MPSTHTCLLYHIIFATKNREPVIAPSWRPRLHEYLGGTVRGLDGTAPAVQEYIVRQEEHHRKKTFREELIEFLQKTGVTYDERYLD